MKYQFEYGGIVHSCNKCPLVKVWSCPSEVAFQCKVTGGYNDEFSTKPDWCPLVEVPEINLDLIESAKPDYVRGLRQGLSYEEIDQKSNEEFNKIIKFFEG